MYTHLLLRCGEIFLKGKNYLTFEKLLRQNIAVLTATNKKDIVPLRGRFILPFFEQHHLLRRVFGLVSYSLSIKIHPQIDAICAAAVSLLQDKKKTFKIITKRSDKRFPFTSPEITARVGKYIEEKTALRYTKENPRLILQIEINNDGAYLFTESIPCFGGLPTGSEGPVLLLVENEQSRLAGLLMMKRGISLLPVGLHDYDISLLQKFSPFPLQLSLFSTYSELKQFAHQKKINILVTGSFDLVEHDLSRHFLILKPLLAFDEKLINKTLLEYQNA